REGTGDGRHRSGKVCRARRPGKTCRMRTRAAVTNALELGGRVARGAEALRQVPTADARKPGIEACRHRSEVRRDRDGARANCQQQAAERFFVEGAPTEQALEGDHADGPDVAAMIERASTL